MKKRILCLLVLLGLGMQAHATLISIVPSDSNVGIGNDISVDLVISGLWATEEILTGFDIDVAYDDTLLSLVGFEFGTDCGGFSCLDVLGFGSLQDEIDWGFGSYNVFELSFDFDADLFAFQPDTFVLGTFTFTGLESGVSAIDIFVWELAGAYVFDDDLGFEVASSVDADVQGGSIEVPEPATWMLLMGGLLGMGLARKKGVARAS